MESALTSGRMSKLRDRLGSLDASYDMLKRITQIIDQNSRLVIKSLVPFGMFPGVLSGMKSGMHISVNWLSVGRRKTMKADPSSCGVIANASRPYKW